MPATSSPPRLHALVATHAPLVAVFRRGPSDWFQILKWDLVANIVEPGVWVRGKLYPRRCDLSQDGRYTCTMFIKGTDELNVFIVISRLPWLTPLESWDEGDTWGRGWRFADHRVFGVLGQRVDRGRGLKPLRLRRGTPRQFEQELHRGWIESDDSPRPIVGDTWDERRRAIILKQQPGGRFRLRATFVPPIVTAPGEWASPSYELIDDRGTSSPLETAQWADWSPDGRLLIATTSGELCAHDPREPASGRVHNIATLRPDPQPAPSWAAEWRRSHDDARITNAPPGLRTPSHARRRSPRSTLGSPASILLRPIALEHFDLPTLNGVSVVPITTRRSSPRSPLAHPSLFRVMPPRGFEH